MVVSPSSQVRCRQIRAADAEAVADLLARGFPAKPRKYWTTALATLAARGAPDGCPEYGYLLEAGGAVVGVVLLIFTEHGGEIRCNVSSWYVEPAHRGHAAILASMASKLKHVTYLNTSPAEHTRPILAALGYRRYSEGQFAAVPALKRGAGKARPLGEADRERADYDLLAAHAAAGCTVLVCDTPEGPEPFVFLRRRISGLPFFFAMQLIHAGSSECFVACAGPLGRALLRRGAPLVICDAPAPIAGLPGLWFKDRGARYFKGPVAPRLNDLAFTEMVVFGP